MDISFSTIYRCTRSLEAIENYARADEALTKDGAEYFNLPGSHDGQSSHENCIYEDADKWFWSRLLENPESYWDKEFYFPEKLALSEWIARVPGLYWSRTSEQLRRQGAASEIENISSRGYKTYKPLGKSSIVLGGVGTLKFPPADKNDCRLVTLTSGLNASSGIPALISPEVWEHHKLKEGDVVYLTSARWKKMSWGWTERFASIRGIPKGYLVIKDPVQVSNTRCTAPVMFHPCTVMEYCRKDAKLLDFVYATASTEEPNWRQELEAFFSKYKEKDERYGRYLFSADISNPLWDAEYRSPKALRTPQLEVLEARVRQQTFRGETIDTIVQSLAEKYDNDSLKRLSDTIGISWRQWFVDNSTTANSANRLLEVCLERNKVEELIDAFIRDYPEVLSN